MNTDFELEQKILEDKRKRRIDFLRAKFKETDREIPVTVWGVYSATGEGLTLMLAYWHVRSQEELKEKLKQSFGEYYSRFCHIVYGHLTSQMLETEQIKPQWEGCLEDFARIDKAMLSSGILKNIGSCYFEHTQITHQNFS